MIDTGLIGLLLIIANVAFSYKGFTNKAFFDGYKFEVNRILINKDYKRLLTSGFLHVSWLHLIFNILSLFVFSGLIEFYLGEIQFLVIYFVCLVGADLLSLFIHRNHGDYSSVGASGAVSGIIFASIALFPGMSIGLFIISMPAWLYGILYIAFSIYGIRSNKNNIGHEAHLGGVIIGMVMAVILKPSAFPENYVTILVILVPAIAFIYLVITRPYLLLIDNLYFKTHKNYYSVDHKYNAQERLHQEEIDKILDKISKHGITALNKKEKEKLKEYSQSVR